MRKLIVLFAIFITTISFSQELNCTITVVAQQTGNDNNVVFKTLYFIFGKLEHTTL